MYNEWVALLCVAAAAMETGDVQILGQIENAKKRHDRCAPNYGYDDGDDETEL